MEKIADCLSSGRSYDTPTAERVGDCDHLGEDECWYSYGFHTCDMTYEAIY